MSPLRQLILVLSIMVALLSTTFMMAAAIPTSGLSEVERMWYSIFGWTITFMSGILIGAILADLKK